MSKILMAKAAAEQALSLELGRTESLLRNAWRHTAAVLVVLGFQLLDLKSLVESPSPGVRILCDLSLGVLAGALLMCCQGLQAGGEGHYPRGQKLWESLKPETVTEEAAEEAMVQLLLQSREQNARLNDAKARLLGWCSWLLAAGALLVGASQLWNGWADWT